MRPLKSHFFIPLHSAIEHTHGLSFTAPSCYRLHKGARRSERRLQNTTMYIQLCVYVCVCTWVAEVCWLDDWSALNANDLVGCSISTRIRHNHLAPPLPWPFTSRRWAYPGGHGMACHLHGLTFSSNFTSAHEHANEAQQKPPKSFIFICKLNSANSLYRKEAQDKSTLATVECQNWHLQDWKKKIFWQKIRCSFFCLNVACLIISLNVSKKIDFCPKTTLALEFSAITNAHLWPCKKILRIL